MNVFNWNENSSHGASNVLSSQSAVDQNNHGCYMSVSEDPTVTENRDIFATGIRIRARPQAPPPFLNPNSQGTAIRRLRLQRKLQIGSVTFTAQFEKCPDEEAEDSSSKSEITEVRSLKVKEKVDNCFTPSVHH